MYFQPTSAPNANSDVPAPDQDRDSPKSKTSPQKLSEQLLIVTPREVPEGMGISNESSPASGNMDM